MYCISKEPTPVFNAPLLPKHPLPVDEKGLFRPLEMIALPGTRFLIKKRLPNETLEVETNDYPYSPLYIEARFVEFREENPPERPKILPKKEAILRNLENSLGLPYIWGGNWSRGIRLHTNTPFFAGLDCSGLIYEATNGFTPRNSSALFSFGKEVSKIEDVKPLDMIVWPGHVVIFHSSTHLIESIYGKGVIITPFDERLSKISPNSFKIRRFFS